MVVLILDCFEEATDCIFVVEEVNVPKVDVNTEAIVKYFGYTASLQ